MPLNSQRFRCVFPAPTILIENAREAKSSYVYIITTTTTGKKDEQLGIINAKLSITERIHMGRHSQEICIY